MSENNMQKKKKGLKSPITLFFLFAIACVIAFLIVALVKTCTADHEEEKYENEILQQELGMATQSDDIILFA